MQLLFFGGGEFAAIVLERLAAAHEIIRVITPPAAPAQRKLRLVLPPAAQVAERLKLPLAHDIGADALAAYSARAVQPVVCDYGKLLPPVLLAAARQVLNIHPSLLPRWRGAAPIERAVLAGDSETGISIIALNETIDGGDILAQQRQPLPPDSTAAQLYPPLAEAGAALLLAVLAAPARYPPRQQNEADATYAAKITNAERRLDFSEPAVLCRRRMLAFAPAAYFFIGAERLRVLEAAVQPLPQPQPAGMLLTADTRLCIACGSDALEITRLQRAGRKAMSSAEFLRGYSLGDFLGKLVNQNTQ